MGDHQHHQDGTKNVHAGTNHIGESANTPIFLSSTYKLTEERYAGWAAGAQHTLLYSRLSSVNSDAVAQKICAMEGGEDAETFASGMAAISSTLMMLLGQGDHMVASADVYGGTYGLITEELPRFGIETTMADMTDPSSYEAAIQENTKILYIETITNPNLKVCDIPAMVEIGKRHNLIVIIDNTFASPWACKPISMGVDLVIHSTTKYLGGHSDLIGGAVVGSKELISKIFMGRVHFGGSPDPHNCYLLERGMRTLHARMPLLTSNAATLAQRLDNHPNVVRVQHVSLPSHTEYEVAQRVVPKGCGMVGIVVTGGDEGAMNFMAKLKLFYEATSLGGVESLIEVPATSSHMFIPEDVRIAAGIEPGYVRISVGIEDVEDLWNDLNQALSQ
ncbi:MAG: aminotransferase class I/II-fold pyridoxal phosphate-dependent enzyme [Candidatus Poseidoniaceae archaeon]|nr:aminotransferase class I/II-fold pyridoxal phosphate-dependent enzyme [Candidatus Poseidoniaceae archaeon]MBL6890311.1 aminotransferase class I/II-fold pyridoxal phosphate-dependent enzyme [Candidatus Poseidoniaceae archaeon]